MTRTPPASTARPGVLRRIDPRLLAFGIWLTSAVCTLLPSPGRGLLEIVLLIGGPAWAVGTLLRVLDSEFEMRWAASIIIALAEWALAVLGALWAGCRLDDRTVMLILLAQLLWPTVAAGGWHRRVERERSKVTK
jgi:hypothetical protein